MLKVVFGAILVLLFVLWATGAFAVEPAPGNMPVSEGERQSLVVGMVLGTDMAAAFQGQPIITRQAFDQLIEIFDVTTRGCKTTGCITDRVTKLRTQMMNKSKLMLPQIPRTDQELH